MNHITLYRVLHLIGIFQEEDALVYLRYPKEEPAHRPTMIFTVKKTKETFDLRRTEVLSIRPYFCCGEYQGQLLTITKQKNRRSL